jgi:hypothetical protein
LQGELYIQGQEPDEEQLYEATQKILRNYPHTDTPSWYSGTVSKITPYVLSQLMDTVKRDSSPGLPLHALAPTKGEIVDKHKELVIQAVLARIDLLTSVDILPEDPVDLVKRGFVDPVRIFVKDEPHSLNKIRQGRYRLIASVSIVDELIEKSMFTEQNSCEIDNWLTCPSKPGIGLSLDDQTDQFWDSVEPTLSDEAEGDVTAWDFSMKEWMLKFDVEARLKLAHASPDSVFAKLMRNQTHCFARSVFINSSGKMFKQSIPGIMKSGSYRTSSTNSRCRVGVSYMIGSERCIAMGDDSVEQYVPDAITRYEAIGVNLKMYKQCQDSFEFCSHLFSKGKSIPLNWDKGLYRLLSNELTESNRKAILELVRQFLDEYRHSPELDRCKDVIARVWPGLGKF